VSHTIDIRPQDLAEARTILATYLPHNAQVWAFGSRASGRAHRGSDLDLAVDAARKLSRDEISALNAAFEDSNLPYTVDVVDLHGIDAAFRAVIDGTPKAEILLIKSNKTS
jgi:predicted nucleotidyltransferase